ncbi:hypothetical protein Taro_028247 [Colocasia esculenta]|uniref:Uncharacterized protein n=1 Tax=Colocasia esculenta TaxID=4460 RepID=A0A843VG13_COLES|nr:hypothetical protein [Colocasia esculenta]
MADFSSPPFLWHWSPFIGDWVRGGHPTGGKTPPGTPPGMDTTGQVFNFCLFFSISLCFLWVGQGEDPTGHTTGWGLPVVYTTGGVVYTTGQTGGVHHRWGPVKAEIEFGLAYLCGLLAILRKGFDVNLAYLCGLLAKKEIWFSAYLGGLLAKELMFDLDLTYLYGLLAKKLRFDLDLTYLCSLLAKERFDLGLTYLCGLLAKKLRLELRISGLSLTFLVLD